MYSWRGTCRVRLCGVATADYFSNAVMQ